MEQFKLCCCVVEYTFLREIIIEDLGFGVTAQLVFSTEKNRNVENNIGYCC